MNGLHLGCVMATNNQSQSKVIIHKPCDQTCYNYDWFCVYVEGGMPSSQNESETQCIQISHSVSQTPNPSMPGPEPKIFHVPNPEQAVCLSVCIIYFE